MSKREETIAYTIAMSIIVLNLRKIECAFFDFMRWINLFSSGFGKPVFAQ